VPPLRPAAAPRWHRGGFRRHRGGPRPQARTGPEPRLPAPTLASADDALASRCPAPPTASPDGDPPAGGSDAGLGAAASEGLASPPAKTAPRPIHTRPPSSIPPPTRPDRVFAARTLSYLRRPARRGACRLRPSWLRLRPPPAAGRGGRPPLGLRGAGRFGAGQRRTWRI